ncbi:hypothetical protein SELMODRAFT_97132 [Selaginella moellendorffii]|uniref:Pentacotripeptide-repeat region of PRORP domain-containing protein n=1 Tax=Selaginella moellendorffii TaxID=88036 RepID=D8RNF3_SELML|nr:hypothetical protein SELMODRAFT_97132 [Selaginella moellendorffii]
MPDRDDLAGTAMVTAFAQNGDVDSAKAVFDAMPEHSVYAWNALLAAYALNSRPGRAMEIFATMPEKDGFLPNDISHLCVLIACSRVGSIHAGRDCFAAMSSDHGSTPERVHYSCMVDLLARTGQLLLAQDLIETMPFFPDDVEWLTLTVSGAPAGPRLMDLRPGRSGPYVVLSNSMLAP